MKIARVLTAEGVVTYAAYQDGVYTALQGNPYDGSFDASLCADTKSQWAEAHKKPLDVQSLLPPTQPSKIVALGVNYASHREEMHHDPDTKPTLFLKPPSALLPQGGSIVYPKNASCLHYEAELAIIMGKNCKKVSAADAMQYILGYTCANDVSERNFQKQDGQWTRAKGYDTFCPLGPYVVTDVDPRNLQVETYLNGALVQSGNTRDLICDVAHIIEFVSSVMTLNAGDVILTGTPKGVGEIHVGDEVEIRIQQVGSLVNAVIAE